MKKVSNDTILIQYSVIQFFFNPYMDKGFENPEERDWLFCNVFFIIIYIHYISIVYKFYFLRG